MDTSDISVTSIISGGFVFLLIVAAFVYKFKCREEISAINVELENIARWLEKPREFKNIATSFNNHKRLAPVWTNFKKTLTAEKYSTTDAAEFFTVQNLTRGMNMTFWQSYGGIFTGLGILGTFAGLTVGLYGIDMTSGDVEVLKSGIKNLLSGVQTAFLTSLFGIGGAILYNVFHHRLLVKFQGNIQQLASKLDKNFPRRSAEDWLAQSHLVSQKQVATLQGIDEQITAGNSLLEKNHGEAQTQSATLQSIDTNIDSQKVILQNIGEDVARAIYEGLDERMNTAVETLCDKLEEKLLPQIDRICAAIEKLGTGGSEVLDDIFAGKVGSQMNRFSAALDKFSDSIDKKLEAANEISEIMNEQMLNTLRALDETLKQHANDSAKERAAAFEQFVLTLVDLSNTLNDVIEKTKAQQEGSAKDFATLLKTSLDNFSAVMTQTLNNSKQTTAETNQQFLSTLAALNKTLDEVAGKIKAQQENSAANFESLSKKLLDNLDTGMVRIMTKAQKDADNTNDKNKEASNQFLATLADLIETLNDVADKIKIQQETSADNFATLLKTSLDNFSAVMTQTLNNSKQTTAETNQQFLSTLAALNKTLEDLAEKIKSQQTGQLENFNSLIKNLIEELQNFTRQQQKLLGTNVTMTSAQIGEAVKAFRELIGNHKATMQGTFKQIQNLLSETETFLELMNDASISLKQAADPVKQSTLQLTKNLTETSTQMKTLAAANQTTRDNLAALSTRLATFVQNFNGIADELEKSTDIIGKSLDNYNVKTNAGLNDKLEKFDKLMAGAVGHLQELVADLGEELDKFNKNRRE